MSDPTRRLDAHLVAAGLARSRGRARELVAAGRVRVDGVVAAKASRAVTATADVALDGADDWVGRAAHKLLGAFEAFGSRGWDVDGARCLDVGASTGGFTQVLLARGAAHVTALDVGHGQLVAEIARDPRVVERSGVNVRDVRRGELGDPFSRLVADLSFISLRLVLPVLRAQLTDDGQAVLLVKPQFEVGRERLGKNGIVRSVHSRHDAVVEVVSEADRVGLGLRELVRSPVAGGGGNREYLGWFTVSSGPFADPARIRARLAELDPADP